MPFANDTRRLRTLLAACKDFGKDRNHPHHQQLLFSFYLHNSPDAKADEHGAEYQLPDRITTLWGSIALVEAERRLLRAALHNPLNQFFALLSDTSIPLYPPLVVYQQLLERDMSSINACPVLYNPSALTWDLDSWQR